MATEWVMIRVKKSTRAKLAALRGRIEAAYTNGQRRKPLPVGERDVFSMDGLIAELIQMKADHLRRAQRPRKSRRTHGPYLG